MITIPFVNSLKENFNYEKTLESSFLTSKTLITNILKQGKNSTLANKDDFLKIQERAPFENKGVYVKYNVTLNKVLIGSSGDLNDRLKRQQKLLDSITKESINDANTNRYIRTSPNGGEDFIVIPIYVFSEREFSKPSKELTKLVGELEKKLINYFLASPYKKQIYNTQVFSDFQPGNTFGGSPQSGSPPVFFKAFGKFFSSKLAGESFLKISRKTIGAKLADPQNLEFVPITKEEFEKAPDELKVFSKKQPTSAERSFQRQRRTELQVYPNLEDFPTNPLNEKTLVNLRDKYIEEFKQIKYQIEIGQFPLDLYKYKEGKDRFNLKKKFGLYLFYSKTEKKFYIGQTNDLANRRRQWFYCFNKPAQASRQFAELTENSVPLSVITSPNAQEEFIFIPLVVIENIAENEKPLAKKFILALETKLKEFLLSAPKYKEVLFNVLVNDTFEKGNTVAASPVVYKNYAWISKTAASALLNLNPRTITRYIEKYAILSNITLLEFRETFEGQKFVSSKKQDYTQGELDLFAKLEAEIRKKAEIFQGK
nr:hypothetical protein [Uronema sp. CCAP 334/1]